MPRSHFHVHSTLGSGYLCECETHEPLTARERDAALRWERNSWRDYAAESDPAYSHIVISGSVRAGWFDIDDTMSRGWSRVVRSWECHEAECTAENAEPWAVTPPQCPRAGQ